jgi:hypothetical protein
MNQKLIVEFVCVLFRPLDTKSHGYSSATQFFTWRSGHFDMASKRPTKKKRKIEKAFPDAWNQAAHAPGTLAAGFALPIRSGLERTGVATSDSGSREDKVDTGCNSCGYPPKFYEKTAGGSGICTSCGQDPETCKHLRSVLHNLKSTDDMLFDTSNDLDDCKDKLETAETYIEGLRDELGETRSIIASRDAEIRMLKLELDSARAEIGLGPEINHLLRGGDKYFQLRVYFNDKWLGKEIRFPVRSTYDKLRKKTEELFAGRLRRFGLTMANFLGFNVEIWNSSDSRYNLVTDPLTYNNWYKGSVQDESSPTYHKVQTLFETDDPRFARLFAHEVDHTSSGMIIGEEDDEHFSEGRLSEDDDDEGGYWQEDEQFSGSAVGTDEEDYEEDEYDDGGDEYDDREGGNEGF